jgi:exo-beta-1,3-glucanase (GH17 family)
MRTVTSSLGSLRRLATLGVSLALAACGSSQNWHNHSPYATIGGTVEGFTGGTLALWNNGGDRLAIAANGTFTFPLQIANGSDYSVVVATQPAGQTCTVANASGTATSNVKTVAVTCKPYTFVRRSLPAIYGTGKAVNYSGYRTPDGPKAQEIPSDTDVLQDLTLLHTAGFNLLRLFGAETPATDVVNDKVLRIAAQYYPEMQFQLGVALGGLTSCSDPKNDQNIAYLISHLSKYKNVATISVGNETSFYSKYMPLACLEGYIRTIRSQVTQPVTADDDFSFYAGKTTGGGDRVTVKPDTILALIDFASIHMYPISFTAWDWRQTGVAAGPDRAKAMMETSLATAKGWFNEVANYKYVGAGGVTVTVGASMPIVIGETGWKAKRTNPGSEIEFYAAKPENAKWYYDLLYGSPGKYPAWQGSAGGPSAIFYFEGFDETWKGFDDGWGLWDLQRNARYALCGTPAGPACKTDVYEGAGYYNPPPFSTITFDSPTIFYSLLGFAGAENSSVQPDPAGGNNKVARVIRSASADFFAGTVVGTIGATAGIVPISTTDTRMTVRVYSPAAGIPVRLKLVRSKDDPNDPRNKVETEVRTTKANAWETLTFDFANQVPGTPALDPTLQYDQVVIFFNFGKTGAQAGAQTFYFDDVAFIGGGGLPTGPFTDLTFDSAGVVYTLTGFSGAEDSSLQPDPTNAANTVVRVRRSATAETFAGTVVSTGPSLTAGTIPFSATNKKMTVRVYSPKAGIPVRLKVEDAANTSHSVETEALTTKANAWETLTFDFANPVAGTPALNLGYNYNRVIIFFNFGVTGAVAGAQTFYFDDVVFVTGGGSGSTGTCAAPNCTDFSSGGIGFGPFENPGGGTVEIANDPNDAANKVVKFVKKTGDNDYFGTTITGLAGPATLTATDKTVTLRVYSPAVGTNFLFKLEGGPGGAVIEKDVATTLAGSWETLSFDLSAGATGTYATVVIFPNGRSKVTADKTMYIDELKFPASGGGGGGSGSTGTCTGTACVDFSEAGIGFGPFENQGGGTVAIANDPNDATNKVAKFVKKPGDGDYFGTTITGLGGSVVLTATDKTVTMRVYSPAVGTNFLLKFEGGTGGPATTEKDAVTTTAGAWETLTFVMPDAGTFTTVVVFPHGRSAVTADTTMYIDELKFPSFSTGGGGGGGSGALITFDEVPSPKLTDFGTNGAPPVIATDPAGGTNKVLKVFKYALPAPGSEQWAGVTVSTGANDSIPAIPFTATAKKMTVRVYSPAVGVRVRLKVENALDNTITCETDAITTKSGQWETLTFDFANPALNPPVGGGPTASLDLTKTYNKISIFSDFGIGNGGSAPLPADRVYYYDDITF